MIRRPAQCFTLSSADGLEKIRPQFGDIVYKRYDPAESVVWPNRPLFTDSLFVFHGKHLCNGSPRMIMTVPQDVTRRFDDPVVDYQQAAADVLDGFLLHVVVDIDHPILAAMFGRPFNGEWQSACAIYKRGILIEFAVLFARRISPRASDEDLPDLTKGIPGLCPCPTCSRQIDIYRQGVVACIRKMPVGLEELEAEYAAAREPIESLRVGAAWYAVENLIGACDRWQFSRHHVDSDESLIYGPMSNTDSVIEKLRTNLPSATIERSQIDRVFLSDGTQKWSKFGWFRRPMAHSRMVDVSLILSEWFPPYVMLEVLDWIPELARFNHRWKIGLLQSLFHSINRVIEQRHLNSAKRNRNKDE